jgi:hypothetical protein
MPLLRVSACVGWIMRVNRSPFSIASVALALAIAPATLFAQAGVEGRWEGTLDADSAKRRLVLEVTRASDGLLLGTIASPDDGVRFPIDRIEERGTSVRVDVNAVNGSYDGLISADGNRITGTWRQGASLPLEFRRAASRAEPSRAEAMPAESGNPFGVPLEMRVPVPPTPFPSGGRTHLAYELHITNFADGELLIRKLEILDGGSTLATFEGTQLNMMLQRPGSSAIDNRAVGGGQRAIAYVWMSADAGTRLPASLRHRITGRTQSVEGGLVRISTAAPIVLGPPLRGRIGWPSTDLVTRRVTGGR